MNKNVLITGGSRGIGAAAVLAFAKAGYNVAFTYNAHPAAADAVRRQAEAIAPGGCFLAIRADAGDSVQVQAAVEQAQRELGSLQVLVCNAGIAQVKALQKRGLSVDRLFVSPMLRTRQTADILFPKMHYTVVDGLIETDFGRIEGKYADKH